MFEIVREMAGTGYNHIASVKETRPTPEAYPHYAGNYRGTPLPCLEAAEVGIPSDPLVGIPAREVHAAIDHLGRQLDTWVAWVDAKTRTPVERMRAAAAVAAEVFQRFLTIHPYLNGNGHVARFCVWAILIKFGYWPWHFCIEPRPGLPNYGEAIAQHRRGSPDALEMLILSCLRPGLARQAAPSPASPPSPASEGIT